VTTVTELQAQIDGATEENVVLNAAIVTLGGKVDEAQGRVDAATEVNTGATTRFQAEEASFAAFTAEMEANNAQIDFELSILDRAEEILAEAGINRAGDAPVETAEPEPEAEAEGPAAPVEAVGTEGP